jgi:lipid-A-disaccharide synthase
MIVAGESSGELYGALLAEAIKDFWPDARVLGVGGERMKKAGVELFSEISSAFGLVEAISSLRAVRETFRKTVENMRAAMPVVVVLIDYPDFNFRVARKARELGLRVLYYVSPQVWAWRAGRVKTMADFVDRMAVVLPFEENIYVDSGIPCEFVGHPILDDMESIPSDRREAREALGLDPGRPCLALLPGSRRNELNRLLPVLLDVVRTFRKRYPDYGFFMPVAPNIDMSEYRGYFEEFEAEGVMVRRESAVLALSASEVAVVASGTATLQGAFRQTPMVVIYKVFPLTYLIMKNITRAKFITIANLILNREAVPELIQGRANPVNIMNELTALISDTRRRQKMIEDLGEVRSFFYGKKPSEKVAGMIGEMAGWRA